MRISFVVRSTFLIAAVVIFTAGCSLLPRSLTRQTSFSIDDLESEDPVIQVKAAEAVADQKNIKAMPQLIRLLEDQEPSVRDAAYRAIVAITGKRAPPESSNEYQYYDSSDNRRKIAADWEKFWSEKSTQAKP